MKAHLALEFIGAATWDYVRQFERFERALTDNKAVIGEDSDYLDLPGPRLLEYRLHGDFWRERPVYGRRDYSRANSKGTRGVMINYILDSEALYRVKAPVSWRSVSHYYAVVDAGGNVLKLDKEGAIEWASVHLI